MRFVITGASGFVGRTLLRLMLDQGLDATGVARTAVADLPVKRVTAYRDTPSADVLVHLAETRERVVARAGDEKTDMDAVKTIEGLAAKGFNKILYISSSAVYGDTSGDPHRVTDPVQATDVYTHTKLTCEKIVLEAGGMVARLSNLFGPGMADNNVLSKLMTQIPGHGPVKVYDTTPVRDFIWIDDAAYALNAMARSNRKGIYNVGTGVGASVAELARLMLEVSGERQRQVISTQPAGKFSVNIVDISATVSDFPWKPQVGLQEGIQKLMVNKRIGGAA